MKRTILASVTVGLAALMTFGCGNVVSTITGNQNESDQPFAGPGGGNTGQVFRIFAIDTAGDLLSFNSDNPLVIQGKRTPTFTPALAAGERLTGIDFRPNTGILYGITSLGKVHYIDTNTANCFLVGNGVNPSQAFANDIDFNPVVDAIRQVSNGQNIRVNVNTGALLGADGNVNIGGNPVTGSCGTAYTNNFAGATTTQLFTIDSATNAIYQQNPTTGALTNAVPFPFFVQNTVGFDIAPNGLGFIAATPSGGAQSQLLTFDPGTGTLLSLGGIGGGRVIQTMAVEIAAPAVTNFVGIDDNNNLVRFSSTSPQTLTSSALITGLGAGETIRGCDIRPGTGKGAAIDGSTFTAANGTHLLTLDGGGVGRIYQVNLANGAATLLSTLGAGIGAVNTTTGLDFNPTNDLLRVVSANSAPGATNNTVTNTTNFSVVPNSGATTANSNLSYPTNDPSFNADPTLGPLCNGAAYTQNFLGSRSTRLFVVDTRRRLVDAQLPTLAQVGSPISAGVLTTMGGLSVTATNNTGIDIEANDRAWLVTVPLLSQNPDVPANQSVLCRLNLGTGQADPVSNIGGRPLLDFAALPPGI
ncbi:DUF4394 domain-containing protein [bacterium]|nr:DUF4394 domain-containing protein [bacterium]